MLGRLLSALSETWLTRERQQLSGPTRPRGPAGTSGGPEGLGRGKHEGLPWLLLSRGARAEEHRTDRGPRACSSYLLGSAAWSPFSLVTMTL